MFDFNGIQALTFDCYGTLIDWEAGIFSALRPVLAAHDAELSDHALLELYAEIEAREEAGPYCSYREVLQAVVQRLGERLGFTPTDAEASSLPESIATWNPFADTVDTLQRLKRRYRLVVMSNIDDDLFAASARKLKVTFDDVITAQQARCYKPDRKIFEMALDRMRLAPGQVLHVGQSIYHDVIPAKSFGMPTVWVNRPSARAGAGAAKAASGKPDLEVRDLRSLAELAVP